MPRNVTTQVLSSDLDCTGVEVIRLAGREGMSKLFRFELELVATSSKLPPGPNMVGAQLILVFTTDKGLERVVAGIVCEVEDDFDPSAGARYLKVSLVPRAHRLSLVTLYESSAGRLREVLLEKLGACDVAVELRISENYENFIEEFLTQYGESDLAFLDRRCQRLGVNYFFKTTRDQGDVMVFTDTGVFDDRTKDLVVPFRSSGEQTDVHALTVKSRMVASNYIVFDYNHRTPLTQIMGTTKLDAGHGGGVLEYGANMRTPEGARWLSKVRAEEAESRRIEFHGKSDRPELYPGLMFTVEAHPTLGSVELLVLEVEHVTEQPAQNRGETGALAYANRFRAIPARPQLRPPRTTPTPRIAGLSTAIVLAAPEGPPNEPWLDENGSYRVRMNCEMFTLSNRQILARSVRMAQASAGSGYGIHFPLRPGTEVVIAFINGDLDRPLIVGAVPNEITPSPVTGAEARVNRIKTHDGVVIEMEDS